MGRSTASGLALTLLLIAPTGVAAQAVVRLDVRSVEYKSADEVEVPALLAVPAGGGRYPGVLFIHGRSGWHDRLKAEALRLAERGFVVLAPDYHTGRFIPENPVAHDPKTETDVERGLDYLKTVPQVGSQRLGVVGISRGGYHAALLGVRRTEVGALVGYYPHLQNPNAPEPDQVYRYMPEVEQWRAPTLLMVGEQDHQLRRELVVRVAERLRQRGIAVELVVYPGAQRAFDFRRNGRTVGDDLARADALERTVGFLTRALGARQ
ncbi:MAG: dienelactone hydrolase family protein [Candidatus Rokubacteria bacterium]|nr:dienelactone hydrolase family protein [Candidatus Rokubacteria bacterium]